MSSAQRREQSVTSGGTSAAGAVAAPGAAAALDRKTLERNGKPRTYLGMAWRRLRRNKLAMIGLGLMVVMIIIALGAGLISEYVTQREPQSQALRDNFREIGAVGTDGKRYWLGSDDLGRDTATRLVYGARVSLGVAGLSVIAALTLGTTVGVIAGFYGRWIDGLLMRFVDIMLSIPSLFLLLLVASMWRLGPWTLAFVIASVAWVTLSRLVRGEVMAVKNRDYVDAARVVGVGNMRIMFRHILPNVAPVIIVWASLIIPSLILTEAALSFLGLGVQPPTPSWGNMLTYAQKVWSHSTAMVLLPGIAIYITVFAINLFGNGLRDALDPRLTD